MAYKILKRYKLIPYGSLTVAMNVFYEIWLEKEKMKQDMR